MQLLAVGERPGLGLGKLETANVFIRVFLPAPTLSFKFQSQDRRGRPGRTVSHCFAPAFLSCHPRGRKLMVYVFT
jgi:hypothetical protein